jgi:transketolase
MVAPSSPAEVGPLFEWCLEKHDGPSFLRLVSLPTEIEFSLPANYRPEAGRGVALTEGRDAVLVSAGPTMLAQAFGAAKQLAAEGIGLAVVNLPWLNRIDPEWLGALLSDHRLFVTLDDHYVDGGQGEKVIAALATGPRSIRTLRLGLADVPPCGQPADVLQALGLDAAGIAAAVRAALA